MKRILLTGVNSYIGTNVEKYLMEHNSLQKRENYRVDKISQRGDAWKEYDFSAYDTVLDVTGISHVDLDKISEEEKTLYYEVNCRLAVQTAEKAKREGVRQFIYLSSIIVYGEPDRIGRERVITAETQPCPANFYGDSKWQAEQELAGLADERFHVAVLRLPTVYGAGCRGNYQILREFAMKFPLFPSVRNARSMLYIEHLNEFLRRLVEDGGGGVFFPQNASYVSTVEMIQAIREANGKRVILSKLLNPLIRVGAGSPGRTGRLVNKGFGSLVYDQAMSSTFEGYRPYGLQESICRAEKKGTQ